MEITDPNKDRIKLKGETMTVINTLTDQQIGKDKFKFLTAALSKDATRPFLTVVQYDPEKKRLWAMDGRRLHALEDFDLGEKALFGEVSGNTILFYACEEDPDRNGPNYERVVPDFEEMVKSPEPIAFDEKKRAVFSNKLTEFYVKSRVPIQIEYIKALKGFNFDVYWFEKDTSTRAWLFKEIHGRLFSVIMPMNIEDYWR